MEIFQFAKCDFTRGYPSIVWGFNTVLHHRARMASGSWHLGFLCSSGSWRPEAKHGFSMPQWVGKSIAWNPAVYPPKIPIEGFFCKFFGSMYHELLDLIPWIWIITTLTWQWQPAPCSPDLRSPGQNGQNPITPTTSSMEESIGQIIWDGGFQKNKGLPPVIHFGGFSHGFSSRNTSSIHLGIPLVNHPWRSKI